MTVRLGLCDARKRIRIAVVDHGSGIAPENVARIFDPFFTTKSGDGGSGLGLFITRGIVEAHGGTVEVTSELGRGTTVDVYLPIPDALPISRRVVREAEPVTGVRPVLPSASASASSTPRRLSLLVIDDERRFIHSLQLALEDRHDVESHTKAAEALEALEADPRRYDVVLCDLAMPGTDGASFYERMELLGIADRFVLMTGGAFTPRAAEFIARDLCPRIGKPFPLEHLLDLLDDVTQGRSAS